RASRHRNVKGSPLSRTPETVDRVRPLTTPTVVGAVRLERQRLARSGRSDPKENHVSTVSPMGPALLFRRYTGKHSADPIMLLRSTRRTTPLWLVDPRFRSPP